ncbi:hypothetical protein [Hyphomicrobium sp.]|uniref:hypothetical protein n=1 Tax=Hyphomicrobium sp. TaxID=82 RepID=UPI002D78B77D|nr:hypothetical protein [Hyphomicrobium sp.]HET6390448.1 hypothetical protein [Hyphomicrobium sp.]
MRRNTLIKKIPAACVAAAIITLAQTSASFAHSGTAEEQAACTPDVLSLCFWDIPNEERIVACLNKNIKKLSPACRTVIAGPDKKDARSKR